MAPLLSVAGARAAHDPDSGIIFGRLGCFLEGERIPEGVPSRTGASSIHRSAHFSARRCGDDVKSAMRPLLSWTTDGRLEIAAAQQVVQKKKKGVRKFGDRIKSDAL